MPKLDDFLQSRYGQEAEELFHQVADRAKSSDDDRYEVLGNIKPWDESKSGRMISSPQMRNILGLQITPNWQAWLPDLERIILNERQLEHLYHSTLITRVNIALQNAILPNRPRVTVVVGPGCFDSHDIERVGGEETTILPDWIVIEGTYSLDDISSPRLQQLKENGQIIAVGDTKLLRQEVGGQKESSSSAKVVDGTDSCRNGYLAQVQHYACMLNTRFGFVLTNKELVLAQFLREPEALPRAPYERGLRPRDRLQSLEQGISSNFRTPEPETLVGEGRSRDLPSHLLHSPQAGNKRTRRNISDMSDDTPSRPAPVTMDELGGWAASPSQARSAQTFDPPSSPPSLPGPPQRSGSTGLPTSDPMLTSGTGDDNIGGSFFEPSERDFEVDNVLVHSVPIPTPADFKSMETRGRRLQNTHPAKALFTMIMLAYLAGPHGRRIETDEIDFASVSDELTY
ncbi:uncharacterized protein N7483_006240 [Penicillium malachiteum]|uniref:uncharacterized protein n=1 Tax=Penicillium malachiteum TaxID=1324776 RepID=UPI002549A7B5|nr:uncharacterized protein N7483_006240 [Penicillium malachiteum]KAJ5731732.1 hypothetical protein N7483_006240 [Penicillium malachiteum]